MVRLSPRAPFALTAGIDPLSERRLEGDEREAIRAALDARIDHFQRLRKKPRRAI